MAVLDIATVVSAAVLVVGALMGAGAGVAGVLACGGLVGSGMLEEPARTWPLAVLPVALKGAASGLGPAGTGSVDTLAAFAGTELSLPTFGTLLRGIAGRSLPVRGAAGPVAAVPPGQGRAVLGIALQGNALVWLVASILLTPPFFGRAPAGWLSSKTPNCSVLSEEAGPVLAIFSLGASAVEALTGTVKSGGGGIEAADWALGLAGTESSAAGLAGEGSSAHDVGE